MYVAVSNSHPPSQIHTICFLVITDLHKYIQYKKIDLYRTVTTVEYNDKNYKEFVDGVLKLQLRNKCALLTRLALSTDRTQLIKLWNHRKNNTEISNVLNIVQHKQCAADFVQCNYAGNNVYIS